MYFHLQMINDPATAHRRAGSIPAHGAYLARHRANIIVRGPVIDDDNEQNTQGSVFFLEFADWPAVRAFIDNEPHNNNGIFKEIYVNRWEHTVCRSQWEFPEEPGQIHWYVRGYGLRGSGKQRQALADAQRQFYAPYDREKVIVRGVILDDEGREWLGSASMIALPTRKEIEAFVVEEPFFKHGLYEKVTVQRHTFGGKA